MKILYHHRTLADGAEGIHIEEMVRAFRELGHEVEALAHLAHVEHAQDVRVREAGEHSALAQEPADRAGSRAREELHGHAPVRGELHGGVDGAHRAAAELDLEPVLLRERRRDLHGRERTPAVPSPPGF